MSSVNSPQQPKPSSRDLRRYRRADCVVVYKTKEDWGGLSNMAGGYPLLVNDVRIFTSEALYQACRYPHLPDVQRMIIQQTSPMTAKMKGKPHRSETRPDWEEVKFKIMRWCLRVKLAQNYQEFSRLLLATRQRDIVEQSRKDDYWGAKVTEDGEELVGENVLGRLLMALRQRLNDETSESLQSVEPLPIPDFTLFDKPIATVVPRVRTLGPEPEPAPDLDSNRSLF